MGGALSNNRGSSITQQHGKNQREGILPPPDSDADAGRGPNDADGDAGQSHGAVSAARRARVAPSCRPPENDASARRIARPVIQLEESLFMTPGYRSAHACEQRRQIANRQQKISTAVPLGGLVLW